jgi:hypothetical protein
VAAQSSSNQAAHQLPWLSVACLATCARCVGAKLMLRECVEQMLHAALAVIKMQAR